MRTTRYFARYVTAMALALALVLPGLAPANQVALDGATLGYQRTMSLRSYIGPRARPALRVVRGVGGVAFVREATSPDGWTIQGMRYDSSAKDGHRLSVQVRNNGAEVTNIQARVWDWELVPLARFVASDYDAAFTYFGELPAGVSPTIPDARVVSYHPDLKDTLLGLRLMQLDLMLFQEPFAGYFTGLQGTAILGGGEREIFGRDKDPSSKEVLNRDRETIRKRIEAANSFLEEDCRENPSLTCLLSFQPFSTYIVGDLISPIEFNVSDNDLVFEDRGLCWEFYRETDPDEDSTPGLDGIRRLRTLSEAFCDKVRDHLNGLHPVVYSAAHRAMRYAGLMRHFKARAPQDFAKFVRSLDGISTTPVVTTPTEIKIEGAISDSEFLRLLEQLEKLQEGI